MRKLPKSIKAEEYVRLMKEATNDKISIVSFVLSYGAGLRLGDVTRLKREDIDESRKTISIWGGKGGVDATVPLPKGWRSWMMKYLPITKSDRTLERKFNKYRDKCKLPNYYTFHSLRHGFALRLIEQGVPINQVQVLMRHSDVSTTGIYLKARPQDALESYEERF